MNSKSQCKVVKLTQQTDFGHLSNTENLITPPWFVRCTPEVLGMSEFYIIIRE